MHPALINLTVVKVLVITVQLDTRVLLELYLPRYALIKTFLWQDLVAVLLVLQDRIVSVDQR